MTWENDKTHIMKFYSFDEIRERGSCLAFLAGIGLTPDRSGRVPATWRGGDGPNVAVSDKEWYDHRAKVGGGILELCMAVRQCDIQQAQNYLGEWLGLTPKATRGGNPTVKSRYNDLLADGYREVCRYGYVDEAGTLIHFVSRLEHAEKPKEFLQGTPKGWGLGDVVPVLYRLPDWATSERVVIVEGEKDADAVNDVLKLPATTNCGGAENWRPEYARAFGGKHVVICRDNDEAGERHARVVSASLVGVAASVRVVCPSSTPKGDVSDWIAKEGGNRSQFLAMAKAATELTSADVADVNPALETAKDANKTDFRNFTEQKMKIGNQTKTIREPRQINAIIADIHRRFCGFPRRVGDSRYLFDHDHDSGRIVFIETPAALFAWMSRKSKRIVEWAEGANMVTKAEIYSALTAEAATYEAISYVPDWPKRADVYYAHPPMPKPSPMNQYFDGLIEFFTPADEANRTLLKAFFCAPLWYVKGLPRPGWIIDSRDGAGSGKTTLVEALASLFAGSPIRVNRQQLKTGIEDVTKRLVSTEGRQARVFLADNITGNFYCAELADFMTAESISGKAPYGRGEESRPNNLTYVITSNSATVDNDLSDRCFFVHLAKPRRSATWKRDLLRYIAEFRFNILADIVGMLEAKSKLEVEPMTRFPEFEALILRGVCETYDEFESAIATLSASRADSNVEDEHAQTIEDEFAARMIDVGRRPGEEFIFIRSEVAKYWLDEILGREIAGHPMQYLRNLTKNGLATRFKLDPERFPHNGTARRRGIMWTPENHDGGSPRILGLKNRKVIEVVA